MIRGSDDVKAEHWLNSLEDPHVCEPPHTPNRWIPSAGPWPMAPGSWAPSPRRSVGSGSGGSASGRQWGYWSRCLGWGDGQPHSQGDGKESAVMAVGTILSSLM